VVGADVVVSAVPAGMEICAARAAGVSEPDAASRPQLLGSVASEAAHGTHHAPGGRALSTRVLPCAAVQIEVARTKLAQGIALATSLWAAAVQAQSMAGKGPPDINSIALEWARGQYRAPMVCDFEAGPQRVLRRLVIAPGPSQDLPIQDRLEFPDPEAPGVKRCFSELGSDEPYVAGGIAITLRERSRPDTASRDFEQTLRHEHGFEFEVLSGRLKLGRFGAANDPLKEVDFSHGKARLHLVEAGSDAAKLLSEFPTMPGFTLELISPDGTQLVFHLVRVRER
ncbi:MAG TPA: hypothetical protein VKE73_13960, partial [Myxococcota bacterium]|nr:hypothetical protein [Myxococcota bacterium]